MKVNHKEYGSIKTFEGAKAVKLSPEKELMRAVMTCMLFEGNFYESGKDMATRIAGLCTKVKPEYLSELAIKARNEMYLRSVPLFLARNLAKIHRGKLVSDTIYNVIQRADEMAEFLAMYFMEKKQPLSKQTKLGLARAFDKFNEYQLAKYNSSNAKIKLRDAMFLCHPKPKDEVQADLFKRIAEKKLETPDTWEVQLSAGKDKQATFNRLVKENKLGYFALLRNLRNMEGASCDLDPVIKKLEDREEILRSKILPFRYMAAYENVSSPRLKKAIKNAFIHSASNVPTLTGTSIILVDVSGSMDYPLSDKSDMKRTHVAACLAAILKENSKSLVYTFSEQLVKVSSKRSGLDLAEDILNSQEHGGTELGAALKKLDGDPCDRVIVLTDEQSHDRPIACWAKKGYIVNLNGYEPSVSYAGNWEMIAGWSDKIVNYIAEIERFEKWDQ